MSEIFHNCKHGNVLIHPVQPGPDQHVVVTTVDDGKRVAMHAVCDFDRALQHAMACASVKHDRCIAVKVQCWHFASLCYSLGIDPKSLDITFEECVAALKSALLESQQPAVRREAYDELTKMGVIR
jgi:hypothetical protein